MALIPKLAIIGLWLGSFTCNAVVTYEQTPLAKPSTVVENLLQYDLIIPLWQSDFFSLEIYLNSGSTGLYLHPDGTASPGHDNAGHFKLKDQTLTSDHLINEDTVANIPAHFPYTLLEQREPSDSAISTYFFYSITNGFPFLRWYNYDLGEEFGVDGGQLRFCFCAEGICTGGSDPEFGVYAIIAQDIELPGCIPCELRIGKPPEVEVTGLEKVVEKYTEAAQGEEDPFGLEIIHSTRARGRYWLGKGGLASSNILDAATYQLQNKQLVNFEDTKEVIGIPWGFPYTLMDLRPAFEDRDKLLSTTFEIKDSTDENENVLPLGDRQYLKWTNEELGNDFGTDGVLRFCWCRTGICTGGSDPLGGVYTLGAPINLPNCEPIVLAIDRDYHGTSKPQENPIAQEEIQPQNTRSNPSSYIEIPTETSIFKIHIISGESQDIKGYLREDGSIAEKIDAGLYQLMDYELSMAYFNDILISIPINDTYTIMDVNPRKDLDPTGYLQAESQAFFIRDSGEVEWAVPLHHSGGGIEKLRFCYCEGCIYPSKKSVVLAVRESEEYLGCEPVFLVVTDVGEMDVDDGGEL